MNRASVSAITTFLFLLYADFGHGQDRARLVKIDPGPLAQAESLLWVAAHPDDEVIVAPLLASVCIERGARCTLMVLTRGENSVCLLPEGCSPTLAAVRSAEAARSSEWFRADMVLLGLPDSGGGAEGDGAAWIHAMGGRERLIRTIASYIAAADAEAVLTFDPRHGTTCHGDHRAAGQLVLDALGRLDTPPPLYFVETRITIHPAGPALMFAPAWPLATHASFDATQHLPTLGISGWDALIATMQIHRSQFDEAWLDAARTVPIDRRAVWVIPADEALGAGIVPCP